jgi:hypothetical protein
MVAAGTPGAAPDGDKVDEVVEQYLRVQRIAALHGAIRILRRQAGAKKGGGAEPGGRGGRIYQCHRQHLCSGGSRRCPFICRVRCFASDAKGARTVQQCGAAAAKALEFYDYKKSPRLFLPVDDSFKGQTSRA